LSGTLKFGPNRVVVEVRRAIRNLDGTPAVDPNGNIKYYPDVLILESKNLTTNAGLDAAKDRLFNPSTTQTIARYIALSSSTHTPDTLDTTLDEEIVSGGLERAAGAYNVTGCDIGEAIIENTFTATATHENVRLMALFDASSSGDLYFEATIALVTLNNGDQLIAKWDKITLS